MVVTFKQLPVVMAKLIKMIGSAKTARAGAEDNYFHYRFVSFNPKKI
jgi:hypothetical protein